MPLWIGVGVSVQIKADDRKAVPAIKCNRGFVAGLRFQNDHPRAKGFRRGLYGSHQHGADPALARRAVKHADIADAETVVPALRRALDVSDQVSALKRAERNRVLQPRAENTSSKERSVEASKGI